jgi:hypothetical protein
MFMNSLQTGNCHYRNGLTRPKIANAEHRASGPASATRPDHSRGANVGCFDHCARDCRAGRGGHAQSAIFGETIPPAGPFIGSAAADVKRSISSLTHRFEIRGNYSAPSGLQPIGPP